MDKENVWFLQKAKIAKSIKRYREKRAKRQKNHKIKYKVRQQLAEKRLRVKGKFVKNKKFDIEHLRKEYADFKNLNQDDDNFH